METVNLIDGRCRQRDADHRRVDTLRMVLAALGLAAAGVPCMAAESVNGLGLAFRPQGSVDAQLAGGSTERGGASSPGLRVVVSRPSHALASIDGRVVHVGDTVNGMRVTRISEQGVVLTGEGGVQEQLTLHPPSVIKRMHPTKAARVSNGAAP